MIESFDDGLYIARNLITGEEVEQLLASFVTIAEEAPLLVPTMRGGQPFRLRLTNAGSLGWYSDHEGYRYTPVHPTTCQPWPEIPMAALNILRRVSDAIRFPLPGGVSRYRYLGRVDNLLINRYEENERAGLGMHSDRTEIDQTWPIVSISIGASCSFVIEDRNKKPRRFALHSRDVVVMSGPSRRSAHGIDEVGLVQPSLFESPPDDALPGGGRLNFTFRVAGSEQRDEVAPVKSRARHSSICSIDGCVRRTSERDIVCGSCLGLLPPMMRTRFCLQRRISESERDAHFMKKCIANMTHARALGHRRRRRGSR